METLKYITQHARVNHREFAGERIRTTLCKSDQK